MHCQHIGCMRVLRRFDQFCIRCKRLIQHIR